MIHALVDGVLEEAWAKYFNIQNIPYTIAEIDVIPINSTIKYYLQHAYREEANLYPAMTGYSWSHDKSHIYRYLADFRNLMDHISYHSHSDNYCKRWSTYSTTYSYKRIWVGYDHKYATPNYVYSLLNYEELTENAQQDAI